MAHFIGYVQGSRGEASRVGTTSSGMSAIARGWDVGGQVCAYNDDKTGMDYVEFSVNGGSNDASRSKTILRVWQDGRVEFLDERMAILNSIINTMEANV